MRWRRFAVCALVAGGLNTCLFLAGLAGVAVVVALPVTSVVTAAMLYWSEKVVR